MFFFSFKQNIHTAEDSICDGKIIKHPSPFLLKYLYKIFYSLSLSLSPSLSLSHSLSLPLSHSLSLPICLCLSPLSVSLPLCLFLSHNQKNPIVHYLLQRTPVYLKSLVSIPVNTHKMSQS